MNPQILELINQILERNIIVDAELEKQRKEAYIMKMGTDSFYAAQDGVSWNVFHLNVLRDLIVKEIDDQNNKIPCIGFESEEQ